jgi:chaperonin cofactor prefoldin
LNSSAEEYDYAHKVEKFWATKREAYIDAIRVKIENCQKYIADDERRLAETQEKLVNISGGDVHYLTAATAKLGANCYVHDEGSCRIIGVISFEDGTTGYLTDSNYTSGWDDGDGDRIILVEHKNGCKIVSENGDDVFLSKTDNDNNEINNKIANLNKMVENYQRGIERSTARLNNLQDALSRKDTLTIDELIAIANS